MIFLDVPWNHRRARVQITISHTPTRKVQVVMRGVRKNEQLKGVIAPPLLYIMWLTKHIALSSYVCVFEKE